MDFAHRAYIIKWSSIWIFLPFFIWIWKRIKGSTVPLYAAIFLPITGIASMLHWNNNHTGDWRHKFDLLSSTTLIILLAYRLIETHRIQLCSVLLSGIIGSFIIQRYLQIERGLSWDIITCIHLVFHYFIFLLAMSVHEPNITYILIITIFIILHMIWLYTF